MIRRWHHQEEYLSLIHISLKGYGKKADGVESRLTKDIPMMFVVLGIGVLAIIMWLIPAIPVNLLSAIIIIIFGFFFATVSSRMVGLVGSSNNPVSGMAIATLLISSAILKATGTVGMKGMVAAISIGSVICIIAAIAGDLSLIHILERRNQCKRFHSEQLHTL